MDASQVSEEDETRKVGGPTEAVSGAVLPSLDPDRRRFEVGGEEYGRPCFSFLFCDGDEVMTNNSSQPTPSPSLGMDMIRAPLHTLTHTLYTTTFTPDLFLAFFFRGDPRFGAVTVFSHAEHDASIVSDV
jgi:hypothetical protein